MGFIPNSTTRTLTAYLTQVGREYLVAGDKDGVTIEYFGLGDPDANYLVASQPGQTSAFNMLGAGFIPDLSGDNDGAIHSLAGGINQRFLLSGGTNVRQLGTDLNFSTPRNIVGFLTPVGTVISRAKNRPGFQQYSFGFSMALTGSTTTGFERVKAYLLPPSQGTSAEIYGSVTADNGNGGIYSWGQGSSFLQDMIVTLNTSESRPGRYTYTAKFRMVPYKSAVTIDPAKSIMTVIFTLDVSFTSSSNEGTGIGFPTKIELLG